MTLFAIGILTVIVEPISTHLEHIDRRRGGTAYVGIVAPITLVTFLAVALR